MQKLLLCAAAASLASAAAYGSQSAAPRANYDAAFMGGSAATQRTSPVSQTEQLRSLSAQAISERAPSMLGYPSAVDAKTGSATFLWADAATRRRSGGLVPLKSEAAADTRARNFLVNKAGMLGTSRAAIESAERIGTHVLPGGPTVVRYQQKVDGLEVYGRRVSVMLDRELKPVAASGYFAGTGLGDAAASRGPAPSFPMDATAAIAAAYSDLGLSVAAASLTPAGTQGRYSAYRAGALGGDWRIGQRIYTRKMYYPLADAMTPAYMVIVNATTIDAVDRREFVYLIDANSAEVLLRKNLIEHEAFSYHVFADAEGTPEDGPLGNDVEPVIVGPDGPFSRPSGAYNLVTLESGPISTGDPWLPAGATETTGNNVDAYLDLDGFLDADGDYGPDDGFTEGGPDFRAQTTSANTFDYPYTIDSDPTTDSQRNAAIVNLFYLNNYLHDFWYDAGFDEVAGNAQLENYGRGGEEGDYIRAEGQDASGTDNANMSTPPDGLNPRMQMYIFGGPIDGTLEVDPLGELAFGYAQFGPGNFDLTESVVLYDDASGASGSDACEAAANGAALAGHIALVDRGACAFVIKVANAQAAGAVGVIVANNTTGVIIMAGEDPSVTIPSMSVSQTDGAAIKTALSGPVTAHMQQTRGDDLDGTMDNGIIAHEFFHYVSNRLIGDASGLVNQQGRSMGEGWSDFATLMLIVRPEDQMVADNDLWQGAYSTGTYVDSNQYFGIRRAPYSTQFEVNPLTFQHIENGVPLPDTAPLAFGLDGASNSEVHNSGEIWANTLWEVYSAMLGDGRYTFDQAKTMMKQYLIAGLMMTPNAPTFLEARDGLLAAALATDRDDFDLMAEAFAKRGMGVGAVAPDRYDTNHSGVVESYVAFAPELKVKDVAVDLAYEDGTYGWCDDDGVLDPGETMLVTVTLTNIGTDELAEPLQATLSSESAVSFPEGPEITFAPTLLGEDMIGTILVTLDAATEVEEAVQFDISFADAGSEDEPVYEPAGLSFTLGVNYDILPNARLTDDVEDTTASRYDWTEILEGGGFGWETTAGFDSYFGSGTLWWGEDNDVASNVLLESPVVTVGSDEFTMSWDQYYEFEVYGLIGGEVYGWDGGVVEISIDGGDWVDVTDAGGEWTVGTGYTGIGIVFGETPSYVYQTGYFVPGGLALEPNTLSFGTALVGSSVQLRFRVASDSSVGALGWLVDNISFSGAEPAEVFSSSAAEDSVCEERPPHIVVVGGTVQSEPEREPGSDTQATITLQATVDDQDGTGNLGYQWTQLTGPTVEIMNADQLTASFLAPNVTEDTELSFRFTVTDSGATGGSFKAMETYTVSTEVSVMIEFVNTLPDAKAGADKRAEIGSTVTLDGSASSDVDGQTLSYAWTQLSGPAASLSGASSSSVSFTVPDVATDTALVFQLTVSDGIDSASDTVKVTAYPHPVDIDTKGDGGAMGFGLLVFGIPGLLLFRRRKL